MDVLVWVIRSNPLCALAVATSSVLAINYVQCHPLKICSACCALTVACWHRSLLSDSHLLASLAALWQSPAGIARWALTVACWHRSLRSDSRLLASLAALWQSPTDISRCALTVPWWHRLLNDNTPALYALSTVLLKQFHSQALINNRCDHFISSIVQPHYYMYGIYIGKIFWTAFTTNVY